MNFLCEDVIQRRLFSPKAGWRSAVIYSVVGTCRLLQVDPLTYLTSVPPRLAVATNQTVSGLLPNDYAARHPPLRIAHSIPVE